MDRNTVVFEVFDVTSARNTGQEGAIWDWRKNLSVADHEYVRCGGFCDIAHGISNQRIAKTAFAHLSKHSGVIWIEAAGFRIYHAAFQNGSPEPCKAQCCRGIWRSHRNFFQNDCEAGFFFGWNNSCNIAVDTPIRGPDVDRRVRLVAFQAVTDDFDHFCRGLGRG